MAGMADVPDFATSLGDFFTQNTQPYVEGQDYTGGGGWYQDVLGRLFDTGGLGKLNFGEAPQDTEAGWVGGKALTPEQVQENQALLDKYKDYSVVGQNTGQGMQTSLQNGRGKSLSSVFDSYDRPGLMEQYLPTALAMFAGGALAPVAAGAVGATGSLATGAIQGGLQGGLSSAINGQGLKGAIPGAISGGLSGGVSSINPAGYVGITDSSLGKLFNNTLFSGVKAGATGGNPLTAMASTGLTGGLNYLGKEYGPSLFGTESGGNMDYNSLFGNPGSADPNSFGIQGGGFDNYGGSGLDQALANFNSGVGGQGDMSFGGDYNFGDLGGSRFDAPQPSNSNPVMSWLSSVANGTAGGGSPSSSGGGLGDLAGTLFGLYNAQKQRQAMKQQIQSLGGMFGQNSPYAQTLQKTLARKDAASGRRSQYGPREVELQARLAEMNSRNAPALNQLYSGQNAAQAEQFKYLMQLGQRTGLFKSLGGMFGG